MTKEKINWNFWALVIIMLLGVAVWFFNLDIYSIVMSKNFLSLFITLQITYFIVDLIFEFCGAPTDILILRPFLILHWVRLLLQKLNNLANKKGF